jgi:alpha-aminoadipic semialdehyde synthase
MKNIIGILREGIKKKGEKRVAIVPSEAKAIVEWGHKLLVQPAKFPETGEIKRTFPDSEYKKAGAEINENLDSAKVIFALKEIPLHRLLPDKVYLLFSHTHKGQLKNRKLLKEFIGAKSTIIDYELITDENQRRLITAFTYNAGYAGMVDTLWTLGKRLKIQGIENPFEKIPQAIEKEDLTKIKNILEQAGKTISREGTPKQLPPIIFCFLGRGKTAKGAREMLDILPHKNISVDEINEVLNNGNRNQLYALHIGRETIYRLKEEFKYLQSDYDLMPLREKHGFYLDNPDYFETNLDKLLPYTTVLMNCIIWSQKYPRTVTNDLIKKLYKRHRTLTAIGDITCDPNGSIEFSKETWIDNPVYIYNPLTEECTDGFEGEGIAVMAVTNLPCEFSADASKQFSADVSPFIKDIIKANYNGTIEESILPMEIQRAVILWKGEFTKDYKYMKKYLSNN